MEMLTRLPAKATDKWGHQIHMHDDSIKHLKEFGYTWLLAGCATGKTSTSLRVGATLQARRILVLSTKAAARDTWPNEIEKHVKDQSYLLLTGPETSAKKKSMMSAYLKGMTGRGTAIVIVNYETAALMAEEIEKAFFDYVIADESQKLKSHDSKQSMKLARACAHIDNRLAMTGTGWSDRPTDVYGQVRWLSPVVKGKQTVHSAIFNTWGSFQYQYCNLNQLGNGVTIVTSYKNLEQLGAKIAPFTTFVNSEEVLTLPVKQQIFKDVLLEGELKDLYHKLETELIAAFGPDYLIADNKLTAELRLHQMTGGFVRPYAVDDKGRYLPTSSVSTPVGHISGDAKLKALLEIVDEIGDNPFVVFVQFSADVAKIKAALEKAGKTVKLLTGAVKENAEFQGNKDKGIPGVGDCLIANIYAGNAGITLTRSRFIIYYTVGSSRTMFDQSEWRCRRPDSDVDLPVVEYFIRMLDTIDMTLWARMLSKEAEDNKVKKGMNEAKADPTLVSGWGDVPDEATAALMKMAGW